MSVDIEFVKELGRVVVGITDDGLVGVKVRGVRTLEILGLSEAFDRAAAAFCNEFKQAQTLKPGVAIAVVNKGNINEAPEMRKVFDSAKVRVDATEKEVADGQGTSSSAQETSE